MNEELFVQLVRGGRLRVDPNGKVYYRRSGCTIVARRSRSGYIRVVASIGGRRRSCAAHRLVWRIHRGPIPSGLEIDHVDMDKGNNSLSNLELVTSAENTRRAAAAGVFDGEKNGRARLRESDVLELRRRFREGETTVQLGELYGITGEAARLIALGRRWRRTIERLEGGEGQVAA